MLFSLLDFPAYDPDLLIIRQVTCSGKWLSLACSIVKAENATRLIVTNTTAVGRAANRRVETNLGTERSRLLFQALICIKLSFLSAVVVGSTFR
ncbi:hypothetical protein [Photorhabdus sp. RM323S]|uniref:hypothetical protein n=1 Tax=Photorhabdus sp. RM323S TaxID=3342828 RepID=UPI0036DB97F4